MLPFKTLARVSESEAGNKAEKTNFLFKIFLDVFCGGVIRIE